MRKMLTIAMAIFVVAAAVHAATMQIANGPASGHEVGGAMMDMASASADMDCHKDDSDCCDKVDCSMLCASLASSFVRPVQDTVWRFDPLRTTPAPVQALTHLTIPPPAPPPKTSA